MVITTGGWDINNRNALLVSAQFVAYKWKRLQHLIHESAPHGFGQVVEETLRASLLDQLVAVGVLQFRQHLHDDFGLGSSR